MNGAGRSRPRLHTEPQAQAMGAISSATMPTRLARISLPTLSQTTPTKPITRPSHSPRLGCWRLSTPNSAAHSGMDATAIAASPDDTVCSAKFTRPLPISIMKKPMIAALLPLRAGRRRMAAPAQEGVEHQAGGDEAQAAHQERRIAFQPDADRQVGRAPHQVNRGQRQCRPRARTGPRDLPGFMRGSCAGSVEDGLRTRSRACLRGSPQR